MIPITPSGLSLEVNLETRKKIPNEFPTTNVPYKIAIVGEAPGEQEELYGRPFVGVSGQLLDRLLGQSNILRSSCLLSNVCQIRPAGNEISRFEWNGPEITDGLNQLRRDINSFNPNVIILVGSTALRASGLDPKDCKITDWRGSLFICSSPTSPFYGRKCLPTLHPANVLREWSGMPLVLFDLKRARSEADTPELNLQHRTLEIDLTASETCDRLDSIQPGTFTSVDIEGYLNNWTMISVSTEPTNAFCICFKRFTLDEEVQVLTSLSRVLYNPAIPKVLQNSLYDNFVLSYGFSLPIRNVYEDTQLSGWEIYSELPKALETQASIWTRQPFYKVSHSEKARKERANSDALFRKYQEYCCIDSAVTLEISNAHSKVLTTDSLEHYRFNLDMLTPLLFMECRGIRYDKETAQHKLAAVRITISEIRTRIELRTQGFDVFGPTGGFGRASKNSDGKLAEFLYTRLGLERQYKKEHGRLTNKVTTDKPALLNLQKKTGHPILQDILSYQKYDTERKLLEVGVDFDGRIRCGYNVVGTVTGRLSCYESPTGSGTNLQTIPKKYRDLFLADSGYELFQCDLSGADGWTVAAHCARLGDRTMLDDYLFGLKPAKLIVLIKRFGPIINTWPREQLASMSDEISEETDFAEYFSCKRVQHSTNYGVGWVTGCQQIMEDSFDITGTPLFITKHEFEELQRCYFVRYNGVKLWQRWTTELILNSKGFPKLKSASGHTRIAFGRKGSYGKVDHKTYKELLAEEPQSNTTYVTNRAMLNLWNDRENRRSDGGLIIEPLHQVHDALIGQWPIGLRDWARPKVKLYFNVPLVIGGLTINIPFDGKFGRSWGELKESI